MRESIKRGVPVAFVVDVERRFKAVQGLPSPIRAGRRLPPIRPGGVSAVLRIGVTFDDSQLTERGWFFDTDAVVEVVQECCDDLERRAWSGLFDFRPTFELVARHLYHKLSERIAQLAYVELRDETFGVTTRYSPA
jgi:6-pyruvoyltetrahydropterin/6-carboxytetrahydropterin synthase